MYSYISTEYKVFIERGHSLIKKMFISKAQGLTNNNIVQTRPGH